MTPTEHKLVQFIESFYERNGYSPSVNQMMLALGHKSKGTMHRYLNQLIDKGELLKGQESGRNVYVRKTQDNIPMAGRIAAGRPIEAVADNEQLNFFDRFTDEGLYQLQIRGDSMVNVGIYEGDIVLIKPVRKANNNQIVVALIDGTDATLKRYQSRGDEIILTAENDSYPAQHYAAERVEIQGVLHSVHKFSF